MYYFCAVLGHQKHFFLKGFYPCYTSIRKAQVFKLPLPFPLPLSLPGFYSSFRTETVPHFLKKYFLVSPLFSCKTLFLILVAFPTILQTYNISLPYWIIISLREITLSIIYHCILTAYHRAWSHIFVNKCLVVWMR